ncbi:adenosylcobinamide-GDP ribazoletransferase [Facklamia sp. 7083-14-GEN3]|uniref:adenosylcobinamide-GDP ribazoletransferase n=1 Tax=Facklamia sp. 7083-14-GEN3 TaxID=2973478 RepID=UPI00215C152D|nr:adenosylcobinamide-GDP ribazoletransferase [Facklamia sp. 7083-14-GEN3]MCR8968694.1 adenosylcobinamide-GDP ribazoletransferase [Facklamia sp. 7083-14-GEN3]
MIESIILYFQFFTAIPINQSIDQASIKLKKGIIYFPVFAFLYAGILALFFFLFRNFFSSTVAWSLIIMLDVLLTRGFHYDALADTADGLLSSRKADEMVRIMKDSAIGANGALILILTILLTFVLGREFLINFSENELVYVIAWAASGRSCLPLMFYQLVYVGDNPNGLGSLFLNISTWKIVASQILTMGFFFLLGWQYLVSYIILLAIICFYRYFVYHKIAGMTGDTMGAAALIGQIIYLLIILLPFK